MTNEEKAKEIAIMLVKSNIAVRLIESIGGILDDALSDAPGELLDAMKDRYPRPIDVVSDCMNEIVAMVEVDEDDLLHIYKQKMANFLVDVIFT